MSDSKLYGVDTPLGEISLSNSPLKLLGNGETFTGEWEDIRLFASITVIVSTDQNSAADGLILEWSMDKTNVDHSESTDVTGGAEFTTQAMAEARFFRVKYTNGATPQTAFNIQVLFRQQPSLGEVQQLSVDLTDDGDAELVRAVLAARKPDLTYTNIHATAGGNLKISIEEVNGTADIATETLQKIQSEEFDETGYFSQYLLDSASINMAVDGTTPVIYSYTVPANRKLYLKRGFIVIEDGAVAFTPGAFGALSALTNGVSVGITPNGSARVEIENWKTNRQIRDTFFDFDQQFRTDGIYTGRWSFTKDLNGPGIVLATGDIIDFKIQDNLSGLDYLSFKMKGILKTV